MTTKAIVAQVSFEQLKHTSDFPNEKSGEAHNVWNSEIPEHAYKYLHVIHMKMARHKQQKLSNKYHCFMTRQLFKL